MLFRYLSIFFLASSCQIFQGKFSKYEVSNTSKSEIILDHKYFIISYNKITKLPNWVAYHLYAKNLRNKIAKRKNKFFIDPLLIKMNLPFADVDSFDSKIYDRGHMAPSEDFTFDQVANDESFVMTNMAPQTKSLNRGAWKALENKVRKWACTEDDLLIITGPIIEDYSVTFPNDVVIPSKFFKVISDEKPPKKTIGFIYLQNDTGNVLAKNAVSVEQIEKITGLKFFENLDENLKNHFNLQDWHESNCVRN